MRREDLPIGAKIILAIWSFKRKKFSDGRIQKYKARICAHGGLQTWGEKYWETYAPVVNCLSVSTLMILSILRDLETSSIDFTLAFTQANLDVDVFMELPVGFDLRPGSRKYVMKLNKSLYGLKQAAQNWVELLKVVWRPEVMIIRVLLIHVSSLGRPPSYWYIWMTVLFSLGRIQGSLTG